MELLALLEGIVKHAKEAHGLNARELSKKARLSPSYLGATLSRLRSGGQGNVGSKQLAALLEAAGLPPGWVPRPPPANTASPARDPYPSRARVMIHIRAIALKAGTPPREDIFETLMTEDDHPSDPGAAYWSRRYREEEVEQERIAAELKSGPQEEPGATPIAAVKRRTKPR
jgi:hypothetical protein